MRRFLGLGGLALLLVMALAAIGIGSALWSKTLTIEGTVNTGEVNAEFTNAFTDDDDKVDDQTKDPGDDEDCVDLGGVDVDGDGWTSCDPSSPGPAADRYDKDVARCDAWVDQEDPQLLHIEIDNGYPSYYCTIWAHITNTGSIPVKVQSVTITETNITDQVTGDLLTDIPCGLQIDPGQTVQVGGWVHVEQTAAENATYSATIEVELVQWNEWDQANCNF